MPKENVNDLVTPGFRAEVGWGTSHVQVGTTNAASPFRFPPPALTEGGLSMDDEGEPFEGWFVTLDRDGCNRMIRALRTARDKAYGADA